MPGPKAPKSASCRATQREAPKESVGNIPKPCTIILQSVAKIHYRSILVGKAGLAERIRVMPRYLSDELQRGVGEPTNSSSLVSPGHFCVGLCGLTGPVVVIQFSYGVPAAFADMCRGIESQRLEIASGSSSWGRAEDVFSLDRRRQKTVKRTFWISG